MVSHVASWNLIILAFVFLRLFADFGCLGVTPKLLSLKAAPHLIPNSGDATVSARQYSYKSLRCVVMFCDE